MSDTYLAYELLVLDAMEQRGDTDWNDRMLIRLVDKRYKLRRATVMLTNHDHEEFRKRVGPIIYDRMFDDGGSGGSIIVCNWPSLRGRLKSSA